MKFGRSYVRLLYFWTACIILFSCSSKQAELVSNSEEIQLFDEVPMEKSGVSFINEIVENNSINILNYLYYYNGSGVALGDLNNDGLPDIYFTSTIGENRFYLNRGNLRFEDITESSGLKGGFGITTGVSMVDINNDGYLDIYICKSGQNLSRYRTNQLFINNGDLTFTESAKKYGLNDDSYSNQAYFADIDLDGDLDMFLVNHPIDWLNINKIMTGDQNEDGFDYAYSDKLYFQNESGFFEDRTTESGILNRSWGLSAVIGDFNEDMLPDIYVANDFIKPDNLYINKGDGTFTDSIKSFFRHISFFSMGSDYADINNDGYNDLFVADMAISNHAKSKRNMGSMSDENFNTIISRGYHIPYSSNTLQLASKKGSFIDIAQSARVDKTDWSWAPLLADFDNDGFKDLFITNGIFRDIVDNDFVKKKEELKKSNATDYIINLIEKIPQSKVNNEIYKNSGEFTFTRLSQKWGLSTKNNSNGAAYGDLDQDGDLDLVINNLNDIAQIYENHAADVLNSNYINVILEGPDQNKRGIGAKVEIYGDSMYQRLDMMPNRGYMSSNNDVLHFGLGQKRRIGKIIVTWPIGKISQVTNPPINSFQKVNFSKGHVEKTHSSTEVDFPFVNITQEVNFQFEHKEKRYNDFGRELLLPHKLSNNGPFVSVGDINNDDLDDFFVAGSAGMPAAMFSQNIDGTFNSINERLWLREKQYEDQRSHFFDANLDGYIDLYVVSGSNEFLGEKFYQDRLYLNKGDGTFELAKDALPIIQSSGLDVVTADLDEDGDNDIVVGGRVVPGKYPSTPRSYILENIEGRFQDVTEEWAPGFDTLGMVTDIDIFDYDGDNDMDIIAVGEWMPVTIFENSNGIFTNSTRRLGLDQYVGWWFSVNHSDLDEDGDIDLIIGNIGTNNKYQPSFEKPLEIYYNDFDSNGIGDIVLSKSDGDHAVPVRGRECSSEQMSFIGEKYPNFKSFAQATLEEIYTKEKLSNSLIKKATIFHSVILKNMQTNGFELVTLPNDAQFSPINRILTCDINNDGFTDIIAGGNMLSTETETIKYDAGRGICLLGNGDCTFRSLTSRLNGLNWDGDLKDIEYIDLGGRGQGILVANNQGPLEIYKVNNTDHALQ